MSELLECANRDMQTTENKQKTKKARPIFLGFCYLYLPRTILQRSMCVQVTSYRFTILLTLSSVLSEM
jgi:hypothetical protein